MPAKLSGRYGPELIRWYRRAFPSFWLGFGTGMITPYRIVLEKKTWQDASRPSGRVEMA